MRVMLKNPEGILLSQPKVAVPRYLGNPMHPQNQYPERVA